MVRAANRRAFPLPLGQAIPHAISNVLGGGRLTNFLTRNLLYRLPLRHATHDASMGAAHVLKSRVWNANHPSVNIVALIPSKNA